MDINVEQDAIRFLGEHRKRFNLSDPVENIAWNIVWGAEYHLKLRIERYLRGKDCT